MTSIGRVNDMAVDDKPAEDDGLADWAEALQEQGKGGGQVVLISDLRDPPEDLPKVAAEIARMKELGIQLRIVTVGDASRDPAYFPDFGGGQVIHASTESRPVYITSVEGAGPNPTGHRVETSVTPFAVGGEAGGVTIRGIVVEKFETPTHEAAINGRRPGMRPEPVQTRLNHLRGLRTKDRKTARKKRGDSEHPAVSLRKPRREGTRV